MSKGFFDMMSQGSNKLVEVKEASASGKPYVVMEVAAGYKAIFLEGLLKCYPFFHFQGG